TRVRAGVLNPVGRYGVAKNRSWSLFTASLARSTVACPGELSRAARARQASMAAARSGLRTGVGQSTTIARSAAPDAIPHAASRSGIADTGPGRLTARMKARSRDVVAPASTELTTPEKSTANPTKAIVIAARAVERDTSVPRQTSRAPVAAS